MADKPTFTTAAHPAQAQTSTTFDKNKRAASSSSSSSSSSVPRRPLYFSSSAIASSSTASSFSASAPSIFSSMPRRQSNSSAPFHSQFMDKPHAPMAPPPPPMPSMSSKEPNIASLMSPPDASLDSFHQGYSAVRRSTGGGNGGGSNGSNGSDKQNMSQLLPLPMSPPISPYSKPVTTTTNAPSTTLSGQIVKDPVLYPADEQSPASPPAPPLFAPTELEHHQRIVDDHVSVRSRSIFGHVSPPRREDYELVLTFSSQIMKSLMADPKGYLRQVRAHLEADGRAAAQRYHKMMPPKPIAAKPAKLRADRVSKPHATPRPIRTNAATNGTSPTSRSAGRTSATPEPSRRVVAPNREDKDFNSIVDYCPPLDTLPDQPNSLKVDWKGQPIDLSGDPYAHLLHPNELLLAGNLRLDCATYLTSKRRIFERRLLCLRTKKEFRKTDAQQACKIDVNKASKLWTAFEKVGWLDARWISQYL
ncbi:hypothetical protein E4U42_000539 [Claviceps africana]|uniref:SWIRM domain-containing protein n=1 Tax=Claviceps africana TaxID=83212 RepID=A0A8K0IZR2_9HYPO|nr:hypothetical protein E4U42_000539 [Claviceps africana]